MVRSPWVVRMMMVGPKVTNRQQARRDTLEAFTFVNAISDQQTTVGINYRYRSKKGNLDLPTFWCGSWKIVLRLPLFTVLTNTKYKSLPFQMIFVDPPMTSRAKRMHGGEGAPPRIKTKAATAKQLPSELHLTKCISTMAAVSKLLFSTQINVKVRN